MLINRYCIFLLTLPGGCTAPPPDRTMLPAQVASPIKLVIENPIVEPPEVEKTCRGRFTIRNVGPHYDIPPHEIGPGYGVFIYDDRGKMLFRNFGGWSGSTESGNQVTIHWNTQSNHLGETSETPFLIPAPGAYELVLIVYRGKRDAILCVSKTRFSVKTDP